MNKDRGGPHGYPRSTEKQSENGHVFQENQYKGKNDSKVMTNPLSPEGNYEELAQDNVKKVSISKMVDKFEKIILASQGDDHRKVSKQPKQKRNIIKSSASLNSKTKSLPGEAMNPEFEDDKAATSKMLGLESVAPLEEVVEASVLESDTRVVTNPADKPQIQMATVKKVELVNAPAVSEVHSLPAPGPTPQGQSQKNIMYQFDNEPGEEKKEGRTISENKRSRSDVDKDGQSVAAVLSPSQASSSTNRSRNSPRTSLEQLSRAVEDDSDMEAEANIPNWQEKIDKDVINKLEPKEVKRQEVINELFHTEKTHVRSLKVLHKVFFLPMLEQDIVGLTGETFYFILPDIDEMIEIHGSLNNAMKREKRTSHIVQGVGQILLERFNGEAGETMKRVCASFCQKQSIAMEYLKKCMRKEEKEGKDKKKGSLSRFMKEAEGNPLCRRLPLPGIVATGYQRLTKYPLLIKNLLKYTPPNIPEYKRLQRALEKSKEILSYVNQAIKECENQFRLIDYDARMDRTPLDKSNNPVVKDYKNFNLTHHKMIHDGVLTWKVNKNKSIEVLVLLFEELIVLLSKQDEKLVLKLHSTTKQARKGLETHSPIIKLSTVLCKPVATNKKAFFLLTSLKADPQMYQLCTNSSQERESWMDVILATQETQKQAGQGRVP